MIKNTANALGIYKKYYGNYVTGEQGKFDANYVVLTMWDNPIAEGDIAYRVAAFQCYMDADEYAQFMLEAYTKLNIDASIYINGTKMYDVNVEV